MGRLPASRCWRPPTLCINGQTVSHADLRDGDLLEIGDFRAVFHFCQPATDSATTPAHLNEEIAVRKQLLELAASARSAASESDSAISDSQFFGDEHQLDNESDADDLLLRLDLLDRRMDDSARALKELVRQQRIVADVLQRMAVQLEQLATGSHAGTPPRRASA